MTDRSVTHSDKSDVPPETDVPAVAYVRMSTDHQKYSTENQLDTIRNYATAMIGLAMDYETDQEDRYLVTGNSCECVVGEWRVPAKPVRQR